MRTVRRTYFLIVALISLEIVVWGLIGLARSLLCPEQTVCGGMGSTLAQALALVLVGLPVFLFHWLMVQRFAQREVEERASGLRAAFLYGVLLGTLIPVVQNTLALVNRPVLAGFRLASERAFVGGTQIWSDNLIAILINLLVAGYFYTILRADWRLIQSTEAFANLRRIYRWVWVIYGLGLTVTGMGQLLRFLLSLNSLPMSYDIRQYWAVNGAVVTLVGTPLWAAAWLVLQRSLADPAERTSLLRLGLLYLLALTGAVVCLSTGGVLVDGILRLAFGLHADFAAFLTAIDGPLAACIPFLGIWLYYGHWLDRALLEVGDSPRRAGMRRVYQTILSSLGLGATFTGVAMLLAYLVDALLPVISGAQSLGQLTAALALLLVGLPLWLLSWIPMQAEALAEGEAGDHSRRSLTRRIYLYLAVFAGVIGGMVAAVALVNLLLRALFGVEEASLLRQVLKLVETLLLFIVLGFYHGRILGRDGKMAARALATRHAEFPVLIFDPGDGFGSTLLAVVQKTLPTLPVSLQPVDQAVPSGIAPRAVVLPSDLAFDPPTGVRSFLKSFPGSRLVVPRSLGSWNVVGLPTRLPLNQTAQALRQLAEGQEMRTSPTPAWLIAVYVLAGLVGLPLLISLAGSLLSSLLD
jgi:hypothetical protein